jgi:DNA-binding SARP family transcriptional activator
LLGPVEATVDGVPCRIAGLRPKAVLAVLGLAAGEIVDADRLIDVVWDGRPPATALNTLQRHISYLRGVLGSGAVINRGSGYRLEDHDTDVQEATRLIDAAAVIRDPLERLNQLRAALALWRGRPLADLAGLTWLDGQADRLVAMQDDAAQAVIEARMELGEHDALIPELQDLTRAHPNRERLHGQLMLALYRAGRPADALAAFHRLRRRLADDLGIDPGSAIRELESAILRQDPGLDPPRPSPRVLASTTVDRAPRQLPPDIGSFAGREGALGELDRLLANAGGGAAVVIAAISGTAGVGKTTLAVHWAHRVADRFPDGQLYVNLRGFDPMGTPMSPAEAVRGFLEAFGVPAARVPESEHAQVAMYRSLTADKRVLVVLDNAVDGAQVRPLLPGSATCVVVVTSRRLPTGLVAAEGAYPLNLDLLTVDEARRMMRQRLGPQRVSAEEGAVDDIIDRCARLPLALAVVSARAGTEPSLQLRALAEQLRDHRAALQVLAGDDPRTDVASLFSWSYGQLAPATARLFRLLGLHPGPDCSAAAAASLAGLPPESVRVQLAELTQANLLTEHRVGRYAFHDLLRGYAAELAHRVDSEEQRRAAIHRVLDHYLHAAHAADRMLYPHRDLLALPDPQPGVTVEQHAGVDGRSASSRAGVDGRSASSRAGVDGRSASSRAGADGRSASSRAGDEAALAWLTVERPVLIACIERADSGLNAALPGGGGPDRFDAYAWHLPWIMQSFFARRGHTNDWVSTARIAARAAVRLCDVTLQTRAHRNLAAAYTRVNRLHESYAELTCALELSERTGDQVAQAHTHHHLSRTCQRQGWYTEALEHARRAHELYQRAGHRRGQANSLNAIGWYSALLGHAEEGVVACEKALALLAEFGDRQGEGNVWHSLGYARHCLGQYAEAQRCYRNGLEVHGAFGDRPGLAVTLTGLGDTQQAVGDLEAARRSWQEALAILVDLHHRDADGVQSRLAGLPPVMTAETVD